MADSTEPEPSGALFHGLKFWFSSRVKGKIGLRNQVEANGGIVLQLEKGADIKIVNPEQQQSMPGSHSPMFIESSVRNGVLESLDDHLIGPPAVTARDVGSITQPAKKGRTPFTAEDDKLLIEWVLGEESRGKRTKGNEIYKQLEQKNSRHTWQAWRDRWIKQLKDRPRAPQISTNAPPTPPLDRAVEDAIFLGDQGEETELDQDAVEFTDNDKQALLAFVEDLAAILPEKADSAWEEWASEHYKHSKHSAKEWREFWETDVCSVYLEQQRRKVDEVSKPAAVTVDSAEKHGSPNRHPESPRLASERSEADQPVKLEDSGETEFFDAAQSIHSGERSPEHQQKASNNQSSGMADDVKRHYPTLNTINSPHHIGAPKSHQTPSRKRSIEDFEVPSSSPIISAVLGHKRQRWETHAAMQNEIPSTPERRSAFINTTPTNLLSDSVINLESDNDSESVMEFTETDNDVPHQPSQSLSEPDRQHPQGGDPAFEDYQRLLKYDSPHRRSPNLDEGNNGDQYEDNQTTPRGNPHLQRPTQDTQALFAGPTQHIDFSIPGPDDDYLRSSPPSMPTSSQTITMQRPTAAPWSLQALNTALDAWIDAKIASGNSLDAIHIALQATTMNITIADVVLEYLRTHGGTEVPGNMAGVWTTKDDEDLFAIDAREVARVDVKHGGDAFMARMDFLREYNRPDNETEDEGGEER